VWTLSYAETVSAAKTPPKKGVSVTNYPVEPKSDRGEAGWGYLEDENTLVVLQSTTLPCLMW